MATSQNHLPDQPLLFEHGDDVLLYQDKDGARHWHDSAEAFQSVTIANGMVRFDRLTEDGQRFDDVSKEHFDRRYTYFPVRMIGSVSLRHAARLQADGDTAWFSTTVPLPETLNVMRAKVTVPMGGNAFPLRLRHGDLEGGEFSTEMLMREYANGVWPVSTTARYFKHDMGDHAHGMGALDADCAKAIQVISKYSVWLGPQLPAPSRQLAASIAQLVDYYTFYKFFEKEMMPGDVDPLLSDILGHSGYNHPVVSHGIKMILQKLGYEVRDDGDPVIRSERTGSYYMKLGALVDFDVKLPKRLFTSGS